MYGAYSKEEKKKDSWWKVNFFLAWRFLTFFMEITDQCPALPMLPTPSPLAESSLQSWTQVIDITQLYPLLLRVAILPVYILPWTNLPVK